MRFVYCTGHNSTSHFSGSPGKKEKMNISIKEETLGQRIRAQRIRLGMTQEELAEEICLPKSTISAYENDKVDIKSSAIIELSEHLETTPNYLLGAGELDSDILEVVCLLKKMSPELRMVALGQMNALSALCR